MNSMQVFEVGQYYLYEEEQSNGRQEDERKCEQRSEGTKGYIQALFWPMPMGREVERGNGERSLSFYQLQLESSLHGISLQLILFFLYLFFFPSSLLDLTYSWRERERERARVTRVGKRSCEEYTAQVDRVSEGEMSSHNFHKKIYNC